MSYIGNPPAEAYTNTVKDSFSGDGSTVAFTLSRPSLTNDVRVVVENVIQDPTVAYSVSGTTLTFTSAPPSGTNNIYVVHLGPAVQTAVPPSEISAATTFASNVTVQGAFTSRGIDDNADAVAMTIDSSENVLIGKTDTSFGTAGLRASSDGRTDITRSGFPSLNLNRTTSDGAMLDFFRDGSYVGTVGVSASNNLALGSTSSSHAGITFGTNTVAPMNVSNFTNAVDIYDLGNTSARWRNLYLSGGVYLGGTGAANYLDDYEEGTYTAALNFTSGSVGYDTNTLTYTKIGRIVWVQGRVRLNSVSSPSGSLGITLPFTVSTSGSSRYSHLTTSFLALDIPASTIQAAFTVESGTVANLLYSVDDNAWNVVDASGLRSNTQIQVSGFYITDA